jgi:CBS domain-containing protein
MRDADIRAIPIQDEDELLGMRDITCRAFVNGGSVSEMAAKEVMTRNVVCCSPDDDLQAAAELMESKQSHPVAY